MAIVDGLVLYFQTSDTGDLVEIPIGTTDPKHPINVDVGTQLYLYDVDFNDHLDIVLHTLNQASDYSVDVYFFYFGSDYYDGSEVNGEINLFRDRCEFRNPDQLGISPEKVMDTRRAGGPIHYESACCYMGYFTTPQTEVSSWQLVPARFCSQSWDSESL